MRVLFDQGTPVPLLRHLPDHRVETAHGRGWSNLRNGALLDRAEAEGFELLVTTDQSLRHQQNLAGRRRSGTWKRRCAKRITSFGRGMRASVSWKSGCDGKARSFVSEESICPVWSGVLG